MTLLLAKIKYSMALYFLSCKEYTKGLTGQLRMAGSPGGAGGGARWGPSMAEIQEAVAAAAQRGALLWTLPWVGRLFWLQPLDLAPDSADAPACRALLDQLSQLRCPPWHGTCFDCIIWTCLKCSSFFADHVDALHRFTQHSKLMMMWQPLSQCTVRLGLRNL